MIDWTFALNTATTLARPGPELTPAAAQSVVAELREAATLARAPVREYTGLVASADTPVLVVDRPRWVESNLSSFELVMEPLTTKLEASGDASGGVSKAIGSKVTGAELGALMAFMSTKVLGQFDPFYAGPDDEFGRLLLVAPNVVHIERELRVDSSDFRQWVCLHEETHRAQFTGVPWMRDHLLNLVSTFVDSTNVEDGELGAAIGDALREIVKIARGESQRTLGSIFQNEQQQSAVDQMTGLMSLLEGHADVVMDGVGPEVVPSVAEIRRKFTGRRQASGLNKVIRRLMGLEAKMRQYRDGAVFVREVTESVGSEGFDAVWAAAENLPSKAEITDPARWVTRVHG